jgi:PAS domain S-box-containing protein
LCWRWPAWWGAADSGDRRRHGGFYRYQLGGGGATVGIMVVLLSAVLGVLARQWWLRRSARRDRSTISRSGGGAVDAVGRIHANSRSGRLCLHRTGLVGAPAVLSARHMLLCLIFRNYEQQLINQQAWHRRRMRSIATEERASMQRFHAYFDHSIVGLAITSLEKGWIEVNDALCRTLGYTRDELTRMTWTELTYPEDLAPDLAQFNRMLAGEIDSYAMDKRFIHKDGHLVDTRLAVSHVRKPDGSLDYVVAMVEDIKYQLHVQRGAGGFFQCTEPQGHGKADQAAVRRGPGSLPSVAPG